MRKVIFVTGTSSGLGLSVVVKLALQGHIVYASMRNLAKKDKLDNALASNNVTANIIECDVTNQASVQQAVDTIVKEQGHIDCLINNAGTAFVKTTEQANEDEINRVMETNFMGVVRTTKAVLPFMRQANKGHIINISSVGGLIGQPFNEIYCASKFAVEGYTESLASYVKPFFNIQFSLIEPGGIQSEFINNLFADFDPQSVSEDYQSIFQRYVSGVTTRADSANTASFYQTSDEVADCVVDTVNNDNPPLRVRTSDWSRDFCQLKTDADPSGDISVNKVYSMFLEEC